MDDFFTRLCGELALGSLLDPPRPLPGGYTHRMVALTTTQGRYAVKLLNPEIMQRPDALENYRRAGRYEALLEEAGLPILPALTLKGRKLHCIGGQYVFVFDYFDGKVLPEAAVTPAHCAAMGDVLARIHRFCRADAPAPEAIDIDWDSLAADLLRDSECLAEGALLRDHLPLLKQLTHAAAEAAPLLQGRHALCHNDMDPKNVLWQGSRFRIIDLECLGPADPQQELLDLALSWAGTPPDKARFTAFVQGYVQAGGTLPEQAAAVYDSRRNMLDWLAYNARRCLFDDPRERATGREQVAAALEKLLADRQSRPQVLAWLAENAWA